jgi:hypothetical protein
MQMFSPVDVAMRNIILSCSEALQQVQTAHNSALKMERVCLSETLVCSDESKHHHNPEQRRQSAITVSRRVRFSNRSHCIVYLI